MSYLIAVCYISCTVCRQKFYKEKNQHLDECRMTSYNLYRTINVACFFSVSYRNLSMKRNPCVSIKVEILFSSAFSLISFLEILCFRWIQVSFFDKPHVLYQKTNSTINSNSVQRRKEL
jgi:hypothetical protein